MEREDKEIKRFVLGLNIIIFLFSMARIFLITAEPIEFVNNYDINFWITILNIFVYLNLIISICLDYFKNMKNDIFIKILSIIEMIILNNFILVVITMIINIFYFSNKKQKKIWMIIFVCIGILIITYNILSKYYYIGTLTDFEDMEGEKTGYVLKVEYKFIDPLYADEGPSNYSLKKYNINNGDYFVYPLGQYDKNNEQQTSKSNIILRILKLNDDNVELLINENRNITLNYNEEYSFSASDKSDNEKSDSEESNSQGISLADLMKSHYTYIIKFQKRLIK